MSITKEAAAKLAQKWAAKKAAMLQTAPVYHKLVDAEVPAPAPAAVDVVNAALADFEAPAPAPVNRLSDADNWAMYQAGEGDFAPEYIDFMCQKFIGALDEPEDEPENEDLLARYVDILMRAKSGMEVDAADFDEALCNTVEQPDGSWTLNNEEDDDDLPEPESDDDDDDDEDEDDENPIRRMFGAVIDQLNSVSKTVYNPKVSVEFTNEQFATLRSTAPFGEKRTQQIGVSVGNVQFTVNIKFTGTA